MVAEFIAGAQSSEAALLCEAELRFVGGGVCCPSWWTRCCLSWRWTATVTQLTVFHVT
jgi:hypothetical protein